METKIHETSPNKYNIERLNDNNTVEHFDCGDKDLNDFLLNQALLFQAEKLSVSYILKHFEDNKNVLAFFSLSNDKISISDFYNKTNYNRFSRRFSNRKRLKSYPAVKITRLGVSQTQKGKHVGTSVLNLVKTYLSNDYKSGCRFITVDAYSEAIPFYEKNGFIPLNESDAADKTRLLYFDLNDIGE